MNTTLTTTQAASMTADELRAFALTSPRQLSLFCTRYAAAKDAAAIGDTTAARQYLEAAKTAYKRSMEDEQGQVIRAARTAETVRAMGAEQSGVATVGKLVVKIAAGHKAATWQDSWAVG